MWLYSMGMYPDVNELALVLALARSTASPAGNAPVMRKSTRRVPSAGSSTCRVTVSATNPRGNSRDTATSMAESTPERSDTRIGRSIGAPAGTYCTVLSRVTETAGTKASGRSTSPRVGSAIRATTGSKNRK